MPVIRLSKQFRFEAAHALWNYDGDCRHIHGHSYVLNITIKGEAVSDMAHPKNGMVMDFGLLKKIVHETIVDEFDHGLMINAGSPHIEMLGEAGLLGKIIALPYQPTCENMVADFAQRLIIALPEGIRLHSVGLQETHTSYAEWHADDN